MVDQSDTDIDFSIITPVYNDPDGIKKTLQTLVSQNFQSYEIIPVDNGSTDDTPSVISDYANKYPELIKPVEEHEIQGSYAARNTGIEAANGEIFAFIDSGIYVKPDWLSVLLSEIKRKDCDYMGYDVKIKTQKNPTVWERYQEALSFPMEYYINKKHFTGAGALVVYRYVVEEIGAFNEQLESGGDKEFGQRVYDAGYAQCYTDRVASVHPARQSRKELVNKTKRVARGHLQIKKESPQTDGIDHPLHPFRYLPPSPMRLYRQASKNSDTSHMLVLFYLIELYLKLVSTIYILKTYMGDIFSKD